MPSAPELSGLQGQTSDSPEWGLCGHAVIHQWALRPAACMPAPRALTLYQVWLGSEGSEKAVYRQGALASSLPGTSQATDTSRSLQFLTTSSRAFVTQLELSNLPEALAHFPGEGDPWEKALAAQGHAFVSESARTVRLPSP